MKDYVCDMRIQDEVMHIWNLLKYFNNTLIMIEERYSNSSVDLRHGDYIGQEYEEQIQIYSLCFICNWVYSEQV